MLRKSVGLFVLGFFVACSSSTTNEGSGGASTGGASTGGTSGVPTGGTSGGGSPGGGGTTSGGAGGTLSGGAGGTTSGGAGGTLSGGAGGTTSGGAGGTTAGGAGGTTSGGAGGTVATGGGGGCTGVCTPGTDEDCNCTGKRTCTSTCTWGACSANAPNLQTDKANCNQCNWCCAKTGGEGIDPACPGSGDAYNCVCGKCFYIPPNNCATDCTTTKCNADACKKTACATSCPGNCP